jgi:GMP synthase (glutamine-hydrolysing)
VDHGLLRKGEADEVMAQFEELGIQIDMVDASERFLNALAGVDQPEEKRKIIGRLFLDVFWDHAGEVEMFAQGTLYPDVIESATSGSDASTIKTHHNRVEKVLELQAEGKVIEPLAELFKDEVRALGKSLGMPPHILWRHPFPGPGLAVRLPGEITVEKLDILREADAIYIQELRDSGWYDRIWQACTSLLPCKTVGVKGDVRAYEYPIVLRAVISEDAMTADWVEIEHAVMRTISNRILNEVKHVNRVLYDISTKPPASIEWE